MRQLVIITGILGLLFLLNPEVESQEQEFESILKFETDHAAGNLEEWGGGPEETIYYDSTIVNSGKGAARLERDANSPDQFTSITKQIPIDFDGETIEFSGFLRTESVSGFVGLWMREDGPGGAVQFDNMQNKQVNGTTHWTEYTIKLPLDKRAKTLFFGVLLVGEGKVWIDDLRLLVDGKPIDQVPERITETTVLDKDQEFIAGSGININTLTSTQIENLSILGKVWGFLKYHHPQIAAGHYHWDFEMLRVLKGVLEAEDHAHLEKTLTDWVAGIGVQETCDPCSTIPEDLHLSSPVGWIKDQDKLGAGLSDQLQGIYTNRFSGDTHFYVSLTPNVGNPVFENELTYGSGDLPDAGFRILALYRLWNIVEYWFPYRNLLDDDWDQVLQEYLPKFVEAKNWDKYKLALLSLIARIRDTHANLWSALDVRPPVGNCYWPMELRFIEGKATITAFKDSTLFSTPGLEIGDIVTAVDGVPIEELVKAWSPFYCASNQSTRMRDIARYLPRGPCGVSSLTIERQGESQTLSLQRKQSSGPYAVPRDRPGDTFQLLSPDIAYIKLSNIRIKDVPDYIDQASGTSGLIIDIRNYPSEFVVFALGRRLVEKPTPFTRFTIGVLDNPGAFKWGKELKLFPVTPGYEGKIAILVDEVSISQAEYTTMAFRAAPRAVVVGSTTAGADGNVSRVFLPGGLQTMISGIGVFYPDKSPTQRVGIIPDVAVLPSREGIRAGRDEILEAALTHILQTELNEEIIEMARPN
jgi:C-terminal processing protease CtpA/Prc